MPNRFALILKSHARPGELIRQIKHFCPILKPGNRLYVFASGLCDAMLHNYIMPECAPYIKSGVLKVFKTGNSINLLYNYIQCLKSIDIEAYNYFLKIDDDDFYSSKYIDELDNQLDESIHVGSHISPDTIPYILWLDNKLECALDDNNKLFGGSIAFDRDIAKRLLELDVFGESNRQQLIDFCLDKNWLIDYEKPNADVFIKTGIGEDTIIDRLMRAHAEESGKSIKLIDGSNGLYIVSRLSASTSFRGS